MAVLVFFFPQTEHHFGILLCAVSFLKRRTWGLVKMCIVDMDRKFDFCPLIICLFVLAILMG